jgi:hypothetical protein
VYQRLIEAPLRIEDILAPVEFMVAEDKDSNTSEECDHIAEQESKISDTVQAPSFMVIDEPKLSFLSGEDFVNAFKAQLPPSSSSPVNTLKQGLPSLGDFKPNQASSIAHETQMYPDQDISMESKNPGSPSENMQNRGDRQGYRQQHTGPRQEGQRNSRPYRGVHRGFRRNYGGQRNNDPQQGIPTPLASA